MSDYHLHLHPHHPTPWAPPMGVYPPGYIDRFVEIGLEKGCVEFGFTEHLYRCFESESVLGRWWEEDPNPVLADEIENIVRYERSLSLERYVEVVVDAKDRGLPIKLGLEVDFQPGTEEKVLELLAPYPFDFLIGSVHWVGAWWPDRKRGMEEYVLAHADFVKRTGGKPYHPPVDLYQAVVDAAVASNTAVEVSSAGLRQAPQEIYPAPLFLEMFNQAGVPITLASDAHWPEDTAWEFDEIIAAARTAGYTEYLQFEKRQRIYVPLPGGSE